MTMAKVCPFCGADFDENLADPGQRPGTLVCPTCFQEMDGPGAGESVGREPAAAAPEPEHQAPAVPPVPDPSPRDYAPPPPGPEPGPVGQNPCDAPPPYTGAPQDTPAWELEGGIFTRIWATIWQMLLHPVRTMEAPPRQLGIGVPLAFGVIMGTFGGILTAFWQRMLPTQGMEYTAGIWWVVLQPLINLVGVFVTAGVIHVFLWIFRATRRGFTGTLRAVAYSEAANIFMIIPNLGMLVAGVWGFICLVGGLSGAQATGKARVFFAILAPLLLVVILGTALALFFGLGAIFGASGILQQQGGSFSF